MGFNYADAFNNSSQIEYESSQHDASVELQGRRTYVFKLDKTKTELSPTYNEAINGRIYLPHFEQRALYGLNEFNGFVGLNNYVEQEDVLSVEYNFARMVYNIRDLKDRVAGKLIVKSNYNEILHLVIKDDRFIVHSINRVLLCDLNLADFKNVKLFINEVHRKCSLLELEYIGDSEEAKNIKAIDTKLYPRRKKEIEVEDRLYQNCTDVIENGDIILTDKYKLYQVVNAYPTGAMINEYTSWTCKCKTTDLANINLPDDYRKIVTRNEYGLPKTKME